MATLNLAQFAQTVQTGNLGLRTFTEDLARLAEQHNVYMLATNVGGKPAMEISYIGEESPSKIFLFHTSKGNVSKAWVQYEEEGFDKESAAQLETRRAYENEAKVLEAFTCKED
jgi:hypothetical protein